MMRSQLSVLEKLDMGRVRRRTSRKARSMTLVVRTLRQWVSGTSKKLSRFSRSRSTQATARGRFPLLKGTLGLFFAAGAVDRRGFSDAGTFLAADFASEVAHFVGPAELLRDARINDRESGTQALAAVADDQPQVLAGEAAQKQILQELQPGCFALAVRELIGEDLALAVGEHPISN